jgi:hypothetical protein
MVILVLLTTAAYLFWPRPDEIPVSPEVEAAINSIEPAQAAIPVDITDDYHKITLGDWNRGPMPIAFREWNDGHVSRNNLKTKTSVLTRSDAMPAE